MTRAVLLVLVLAASASAQTNSSITYRVKQKDTLELIAAEQYGDRDRVVFIAAENKLKDKKVRPGMRLRIPTTREITTAKSDTFKSLAQTHLGDERRAEFLASYNDMPVEDTPATGTPLVVPFHITHFSDGGESLAQISTKYFGDNKQADLIRRYNFLEKTTLDKGESVLVPVLTLRVKPARQPALDADAKTRRDERAKAMAEAEVVLPVARAAWLRGDFAHVRSALESLATRLQFLDVQAAIDVGLLYGRAHLAFDDTEAAATVFGHVLDLRPSLRLSAYADSPKVIEAWKKAGGQLVD